MKKIWPYPKYKIKPVLHDFSGEGVRQGWVIVKKNIPFTPWMYYSDLKGSTTVFANKQEAFGNAANLMYGEVDASKERDGELIVLWLRGMM